jgi:hypothetical protein
VWLHRRPIGGRAKELLRSEPAGHIITSSGSPQD